MHTNLAPANPFYDLQPPADETPSQRTARKKRELDAQHLNDAINKQINQNHSNSEKDRKVVKVLLLGQSESGKSTMIKNLRMKYAQEEWERERDSWRVVVQFNVVQSVNSIIRLVESELHSGGTGHSDDNQNTNGPNDAEAVKFTNRHQLLLVRLAPLLGVEADLKRWLAARSDEYTHSATSLSAIQLSDSVSATIAGCKDDIKALWQDQTVRMALKRRRIQVRNDNGGFFPNDLDRVTGHDYVVRDDDIVRAKLRTVGIQEHRIYFKQGPQKNLECGRTFTWEWRIFDVDGCRTKREAWLPYFDNVNVAMFFSPVSAFDQFLEEDPSTNRLEDSIIAWTSICSSTLLARTQLILFLSKCDLLLWKLKRGVQVRQHLPSYGDRPNEIMTVVKYLREKFIDIEKRHSVEHRPCYVFPATTTDTIATGTMLNNVRDCVVRENLAASQFI